MTIPIGAITDEFSLDIEVALEAMSKLGMTIAELRLIGDRNIIDLSDEEVRRIREQVEARGMRVLSIASPVLKCVLPDAPPLDERFQQDVFGSAYTIADQPRLAQRAMEIAELTGAKFIRVFSYWRTTAPEQCHDRIVAALRELADTAGARGLIIGLENEHACNVATTPSSRCGTAGRSRRRRRLRSSATAMPGRSASRLTGAVPMATASTRASSVARIWRSW